MPGQMESAFLERFEHKKDDVKHRLNDIVDDLFAYLAVELTRLAQPPDRQPAPILVAVVPNNTNNVQQPKKVPPVLEIKEEVVDDDEPIVDNHNQISQTRSAEISSSPNSVANNVVLSTSCIATTSSSNLTVSIPSTSSGTGSSTNVISSSHHQPPIISIHSGLPNDEIELDEEYLDEHSDSDCDCEQCMGVPICKVDIDDIDPHDRPAKKQKTNCNSANNSSNNQHHDSIADYHDGDDGEQCSATFKTISIKCSQDDCPSMFKNKIERNQHLLYVHGILPYTCLMNGCSKGFDNVRQYGEHVNVEHKDVSSWPCNKCSKVCTDHRLLCRHIYFYHQEGRFKCRKSKCNFVAPYRIEVRRHSQLHTEMYACQFGCGKSFSHTHHRKRHERIHLRLKPFRCKWPNCGYCSEARSTVIRHIRIRHFNLPLTLKQQNELNIVDNRDPRDYMEILTELMN